MKNEKDLVRATHRPRFRSRYRCYKALTSMHDLIPIRSSLLYEPISENYESVMLASRFPKRNSYESTLSRCAASGDFVLKALIAENYGVFIFGSTIIDSFSEHPSFACCDVMHNEGNNKIALKGEHFLYYGERSRQFSSLYTAFLA